MNFSEIERELQAQQSFFIRLICAFFPFFGFCSSGGPSPSPPTGSPPTASPPTGSPPTIRPPTGSSPSGGEAIIGGPTSGGLTKFTDEEFGGALRGGQCEFASNTATAQGNDWWGPYIAQLRWCAVDSNLLKGGRGCGDCYLIEFSGTGGTDPGRAGSAVIQVTDGGSGEEFDCQVDAFEAITGARTGIFPVTYTQVECNSDGVFVVVLDGNNAFFTKVLIAGGPTGAASVKFNLGSQSFDMFLLSGATWAVNLSGTTNVPTSFDITWTDGSSVRVGSCFGGSWPVATSSQCST